MSVVATNSWEVEFLKDLVPAAGKTALLFEISYFCLGKFPELERIIRANAVEVQMAFNTSDVLLMQCIDTSDNMMNILIPILQKAVQKGDGIITVNYLHKAQQWIQDIIREVKAMEKEYGNLSKNVAQAASDVNSTKAKVEEKKHGLSQEVKTLQKKVDGFCAVVKTKEAELAKHEKAIEDASQELQDVISDIGSRNKKFGIASLCIPIIGLIVDAAQRSINNSKDTQRLETARDKLNDLRSRRSDVTRDLGQAENTLMDLQFQLTKESMELGIVPDPVHLPEVLQNLTRISKILMQLRKFWEGVEKLVKGMEQKTMSGECLVNSLEDYKEEFVEALKISKEAWMSFRCGCVKVSELFALKNQNAYDFLERNPSTLTEEEWQRQYEDLKARLEDHSSAALTAE